ncbi:MAG TPA: heme exporter protein CcmD [Thermohalobaculum sp.]|nr:heme exporter protein CcmD [Thermohalobaculum sp.]
MILGDPYAVYVTAAYGATAAILGWLLWSSLAASARARRELDEMERGRER